jgi:hypothetical protein
LYIEQQIPRPVDNKRRRKLFYSGKKKRDILSRHSLWLTLVVLSFIKHPRRKEEEA